MLTKLENQMKLKMHFVDTTLQTPKSGTSYHAALPRAMRKTLRITTPKAVRQTKTSWDADLMFNEDYVVDEYFNANTCDPDFDIDGSQEFGDIDNEYEGLTTVHTGKDTRRWLKGYNIL
jgi:hypothetical protein